MKNIIKISALFCAAALAFVSCQEEIDTAQYGDSIISLASFGPNPAMRGGTVTFYGSNLDKIVEVDIPGMDPLRGSDIEVVKSGKLSEIRVILGVESPEVGVIKLVTPDGKVLETKSSLTYKEPIVFDGFNAKTVNFPGETITITGTYVDLIKAVIFEGGEEVKVLDGSTRHEAKVVIPATALTGKIILSDKAEIESLFYSEKDLVMGEPTVAKNAKATIKAGSTITVKGSHLEMIEKIVLDGAEVTDFVLAEDNGSISFILPATAKDGVINFVSYAGKEYPAAEFVGVVPAVTKVAPEAVKAGKKLTITGTNLDLVTAVKANGAPDKKGEPTYLDLTFTAKEKELVVDMSSLAIEGNLYLLTDNETEVKTTFALVHPTVTGVAPTELYAGDEPVIVKGTDLDLVVSATLGGKDAEIKDQTETSLSVATTVSSVSGKVVLTLANGEVLEPETEISVKYHALVIVSERPAGQHIGEEVVLKGENMNLVESVYIGDEKVTKYVIRKDDEIIFIMPWLKVGMYDLKFVLYSGDEEKQPAPIEVQLEREIKTIFKGSQKVAWNDTDSWLDTPGDKALSKLAYGGYDWSTVKPGTSIVIYYNKIEAAGYSQMRIGDGSWGAIPSWVERAGGKGEIDLDGNVMVHVLTKADLAALVAGNGMVICGHGYEITEVQLINEISQEITIWEGKPMVADDWTDQPYAFSDGGAEFTQFGVKAGMTIFFYVESINSEAYKLQVVEGHWGPTYLSICAVGADTENGKFTEYDLAANGGKVGLVLTEDMYTAAMKTGGWGGVFVFNGDNCQITKITVQ